jgi:hypothetical protein
MVIDKTFLFDLIFDERGHGQECDGNAGDGTKGKDQACKKNKI